MHRPILAAALVAGTLASASKAAAQASPPAAPLPLVRMETPGAPPVSITLQDALARARANDAQFQSSVTDAALAREDRLQARAALLPTLSATTQYLGNQSNGVNPNGRFVSMDGVHMYRAWAVAHEELSANTLGATPYRRAQAAEALAQARADIAARGLVVTVTKDYYAAVTAERRYRTAGLGVTQASRFLDITRQQEQLGQVAHSDAVKAEIAYGQQQQAYRDAAVALENTRLTLAVLLFPSLSGNFALVDDLSGAPALPPFDDVRTMAERGNPELRAANETLRLASHDVGLARHAFLPTLSVDAVYGIEANQFALHSRIAAQPELGVLPNLGYAVTLNLNMPVWDWGGLRSKLRQSRSRERQAGVELSQAQRQLVASLYAFYNEAIGARAAVENLRHVADLAAESLRLTTLRYQAGESTALEVVDAQTTDVQARNAYDEAENRYRTALVELQTMTGTF